MAEVLKADVFELVGMACNASTLRMREGHEGALDRIAALGAAAAEIAIGADLAGLPLAAAQADVYRASAPMADLLLDPGTPDERDRLAAELGQNVMHIRYGGQDSLLPSAIRTFARWLAHRRLFAELAAGEHQDRLTRFSARVLHEWLSDVCIACGGSGKHERTRGGSWVRPRGSMQRNATFRPCTACQGSGRASPSHGERARWLGLTNEIYDAERWPQRFNAALHWLKLMIVGRMKRPLTNQLERRRKRI
jgi:hypothetical protein